MDPDLEKAEVVLSSQEPAVVVNPDPDSKKAKVALSPNKLAVVVDPDPVLEKADIVLPQGNHALTEDPLVVDSDKQKAAVFCLVEGLMMAVSCLVFRGNSVAAFIEW